jgi:hypothetical protein
VVIEKCCGVWVTTKLVHTKIGDQLFPSPMPIPPQEGRRKKATARKEEWTDCLGCHTNPPDNEYHNHSTQQGKRTIKGTKTKRNRLCLLCGTYISLKDWKKHLPPCERMYQIEGFFEEQGIKIVDVTPKSMQPTSKSMQKRIKLGKESSHNDTNHIIDLTQDHMYTEPHGTINSWCCACEYDQIELKWLVEEARKRGRQELIDELHHEQQKMMEGFSHKDCKICSTK